MVPAEATAAIVGLLRLPLHFAVFCDRTAP